jgi:hypothetical protein
MTLKLLLVLSVFVSSSAYAQEAWNLLADIEARAASCANNDADKANISNILKKMNPFGTWKGTLNDQNIVAVLSKDSKGNYKGKASIDGSNYGPYTIKICDFGTYFAGVVFGYEAKFEILSKTKMKVYSPLDETETVILKKQ